MKLKIHRWGRIACLLVLLAGSIVQTLGGSSFLSDKSFNDWGNDDAYISYRYAENLVRGNGLVFNRGERVEGYSNFLYVLLMTPGFLLTNRDGVYFFSVLLNLVFALAAFWVFTEYIRRELGDGSALAASLLFALCLPLWVAVASGLETCLVLLISIAIWVVVERVAREPDAGQVTLLCVLSVLSLMARVDGFLIPGLAILYLLLRRRFRVAFTCASVLAVVFAGYELWRYHYYGSLLPTTYYVKVVGPLAARVSYALDHLWKIALFGGLLAYLLTFLFLLVEIARDLGGNKKLATEHFGFHILFAASWLAYWVYIGGDHFWDRFLIILFPLGIFTLLKYLKAAAKGRIAAFVVILLAILQVGPAPLADARYHYVFDKYDCWVTVGKFLGGKYPGRTLTVAAIGKMPFFSDLYTLDMLGLADPVIAHGPVVAVDFEPGHMKYNPQYILSRKPDLIAVEIHWDGDLNYGLSRGLYQAAGYQVEYLANTRRIAPLERIINVSGFDERALQGLMTQGYDFAVLMKK